MSQRRPNKSKQKLTTHTIQNTSRFSPRIARIKASANSEKLPEEIQQKLLMIATPKPPSRVPSRTPFIPTPQVLHFTKLKPFQKSQRITARSHSQAKNPHSNFNTTNETSNEISISMLPRPQDFSFFLIQLLDIFSSPEILADFFFLGRENRISYFEFFESCEALEVTRYFSNLKKIFEEICIVDVVCKEFFLEKAIETQNSEIRMEKELGGKRHSLESVMGKVMLTAVDGMPNKTKKILQIIKSAKDSEELLGKIKGEVSEIKLSPSEVSVLMHYSKAQKGKKQRKLDLNSTTKLNRSPYKLIQSAIGYNKNL